MPMTLGFVPRQVMLSSSCGNSSWMPLAERPSTRSRARSPTATSMCEGSTISSVIGLLSTAIAARPGALDSGSVAVISALPGASAHAQSPETCTLSGAELASLALPVRSMREPPVPTRNTRSMTAWPGESVSAPGSITTRPSANAAAMTSTTALAILSPRPKCTAVVPGATPTSECVSAS